MEWEHDGIRITDDPDAVDLDVVHPFLSTEVYWSPGVPREVVERAVANSVCLSALDGDDQVGLARLVTDRATFAWLCDVFVLPDHRGRGLGRALARAAVEHPDVTSVRRVMLATRDAHGMYEPLGFRPLSDPATWLSIRRRPEDLYGTGDAAIRT